MLNKGKTFGILLVSLAVLFLQAHGQIPPRLSKPNQGEFCFHKISPEGYVMNEKVAFRQILENLYQSPLKNIVNRYGDPVIRAAIQHRIKEDEAVVFVWHYQFCPAIILERQLELKEYVWATRATAILATEKDPKDPVIQRKLRILRNSQNHNRRIGFPMYLVSTSGKQEEICGMGPLYGRLFKTGIENNFLVRRTLRPAAIPTFDLTMLKKAN